MEYSQMADDNGNGKDMRLEITQDKLVDILQHAATRQDIADLRVETNANITGVKAELKAEIGKLESHMDSNKAELKAEISKVENKIEAAVNKSDSNFKWTMGVLIVTILVPIALHFVK